MRQIHAENERLRAEVAELRERAARAERQLHAAGAVQAATIESLPFDFWARDREGYCFSQNSTALANWGDLRHRRPEDMEFPPEVIATWLANNRRALAGEIVRGDVEYTIRGERRYVENILAPIRMDDAIVGTLGVNVDVTERTLALQALRESDEKLRLAVDAAGVGLWSWDPLGDRIVWEPGMSAIFGLPPDGSPAGLEAYLALLHPEDRGRTAARIASGMEASRWEDEYRIVRADGAGTTFSLYVPHEPEPPTEPAASREPTAPNGTETLLVVDDEDAVRRVVSHILGSAGYRVLEAPSGLDALALLASPEVARTVAVVVLDVSMPGPTSRELRARLRELTRARILYFTGHAFDAVDVDAGDAVLEKPVSERQLLQKVRQVIDQEA